MVVVDLGTLKKEADSLANFLKPRVTGELSLSKKRIEIQGEKTKEIKLLLHKFLRERGLAEYRVLVQSGVIGIVPVKQEHVVSRRSDRVSKGISPFPPLSSPGLPLMSTVYPNYPPGSQIKWRKAKR